MQQFIAFEPDVEVMGTPVLAFARAVEMLENDPAEALQQFSLAEIDADDWISQQTYLDMLKYFMEQNSNILSMVAIGMATADQIDWPAELSSLEDALIIFEKIYQRAHRNGPTGNYAMSVIADNHMQVKADTPYPSDFDYGLFVGITRRFAPADGSPVVTRQENPSRILGDAYCLFDIVW